MSELKALYFPQYGGELGEYTMKECYLKSEADKVIARHKYKRCLAMAKWCIAKSLVSDYEKDETRMQWWAKWHKNWSSLADKFKEANNA